MQELKLISWCDVCHTDYKKAELATNRYVLTLKAVSGKGQALTRGLDLCAEHGETVEALRRVMTRCGTTVPKAEEPGTLRTENQAPEPDGAGDAETVGQRPCPVCGRVLHKWVVIRHLVKVHKLTVPAQPKKCPDCGDGYAEARSMIGHRRSIHGYDYAAEVAKQRTKGKR